MKSKGVSAAGWFYGRSFHSMQPEPTPAVPVPAWRANFVCPDCACNTCDGAGARARSRRCARAGSGSTTVRIGGGSSVRVGGGIIWPR